MKRPVLISAIILTVFAQSIFAGQRAPHVLPEINDGSDSRVLLPAPAAKAVVDTTYLLGGPDRWDGSFETPGGQPDWHGWTHVDLTADWSGENHWHVSTYWAEYIEGHGIGNHALYCGDETIPACDPPDTIGGVGPNFFDNIEWRQSVANASQPVTVRLTGLMNYDLPDAGWDFLELFVQRGIESEMLETWTGSSDTTVVLDFETVMLPGEFVGPDSDQVRLFWRVWTSQDGWDDVDCINPSHGACQIDDLAIYFDDVLITFDDFESGESPNWVQAPPLSVGDFTHLRNDLGDIDPCRDNNTWQVNFVDDGIPVPETGGTPCYIWCYDPGGWQVNNTGGLLVNGGGDWFLNNRVISPPIAWPAGIDGAEFDFDVYRHETLAVNAAGVFYQWHVRSTDSDDVADLELAPWLSRNQALAGGPDYMRHKEPISDLLVPGRKWVQVSMSANELGWLWGWNGPNGTPAPYFDNVAVKAWDPDGPAIEVDGDFLFADAFPETDVLDPVNLENNWCRLDASSVPHYNYNTTRALGDSLVADVNPIRHGATVTQAPTLHWVMACNPTFDVVRPDAPDGLGILRGMTPGIHSPDDPLDRWFFDLPDTGFFFPGDRMHYYLTAGDDLDGDIRTSVWPPDTTGVLDFSPSSPFPDNLQVSALPNLTQPVPGEFAKPSLLFCDGARTTDAADAWFAAFEELGLERGVDFDVMSLYPQGTQVGLGAQATLADLSRYQSLVYSSGTSSIYTLSGDQESDDAQLVSDWLATGDRRVLLAGDGMVTGLDRTSSGEGLVNLLGVGYHSRNISAFNGGYLDLQVSPVAGNGVLPDDVLWFVDGNCPGIRAFDSLMTSGTGQSGATLDPEGTSGGPYSALVTTDDAVLNNRTAVMPFDLERVVGLEVGAGKNGASFSSQAHLLNFLLTWLEAGGVSDVGDLPGVGQVSVTAHPNPFNPTTTIAFELPRAVEVSLEIFDLQGRLVRRLLDENPHASGSHQQVWDGHDSGGQVTASGVYFYKFTAGDQNRVGKLTLLK